LNSTEQLESAKELHGIAAVLGEIWAENNKAKEAKADAKTQDDKDKE